MLSIGQMAQLCQTSVQTLRLYDDHHVLTAAYRNPQSGYRYYQRSQLFQFNVIKYLQQTGLTLAQIQTVLNQPNPHLLNFWRQQITTAQQSVAEAKRNLKLVTFQHQQAQLIQNLAQHLDAHPFLSSVDRWVAELPFQTSVTPLDVPDTSLAPLNQALLRAGELPNLEYSFTFPKQAYTTLAAISYTTAFKTLVSPNTTAPTFQVHHQLGTYLAVAFRWSRSDYLTHYQTLYRAATHAYPHAQGPILERSFPLNYGPVGNGEHFLTELSLQVKSSIA